MTDAEICTEAAALQWEIVIETAHAVPKAGPERATELKKLEWSDSILDRYAAKLAREWGAT